MPIMKKPAICVSESNRLSGFAPDWPAPIGVKAFCAHQNPDMEQELADFRAQPDREMLKAGLSIVPKWLKQTHGVECINITHASESAEILHADAAYFCGINNILPTACVVLTADCLPILLCSLDGQEVAAIHAGWRGLVAGVIESALQHFRAPASEIMAWLGPAISQTAFEVGPEVRAAFLAAMRGYCEPTASAFKESTNPGRYFADLYQLARLRFYNAGVNRIHGGDFCTYADHRFPSFRRDGSGSGRMATLIWLAKGGL